ncbi:MAG TPA: glycoside hydrolase family 16 protein [Longimicrobium sp.]
MRTCGLAALLLTLALPVAHDSAAAQPAARITAFQPPAGTRFPGQEGVAVVRVRNDGPRADTFWIGYSVQDPGGRWHDVASRAITLAAGKESAPVARGWTVPADATTGPHRVVAAIWSSPPERPGAVRLATADRPAAFTVFRRHHEFAVLDTARWSRGRHPLGRGRVVPGNVTVDGDNLRLTVASDGHRGAELRTRTRHLHGSYAVRMRTAPVPGTVTALFLYQDVAEGNDEIDIEIVNVPPARVILATWVAGEITNRAELPLPFDPAAGFHEYRIDFHPGRVAFLIDGAEVQRWTRALPTHPMRLMVNAWWPRWLTPPPAAVGHAEVDWVRY